MKIQQEVLLDDEGYLVHPEDWTSSLAEQLAKEENIQLDNENSQEYNIVIQFMRNYWQQNQVAPDIRHVAKHLAEHVGVEKKKAKKLMFTLFPYGYVKQACKIAGMKRPRAWSTG